MARKRSTRRTPLLRRLGRWLSAERTPLAGLALVGIATLFAVWVSLAGSPNAAQREAVIGALGGGVYLVGVILAGLGTALALRLRRPNGVQTRRGAGMLALLAAAWGIAGAMSPEATLGGVSLAGNSLGGDVGAALATGRGAIVIALLVLGGVTLISPQFSRSAALMGGRLMRSGGRELAARGPGVVAALAGAIWVGIRWYVQLVGGALAEIVASTRAALERRRLRPVAAPVAVPIAAPRWATQVSVGAGPQVIEPPAPAPLAPQAARAVETGEPLTPPPAPAPTKRTLNRQAADGWRLPPLNLLDGDSGMISLVSADVNAKIIVDTLASFGVDARVAEINRGPTVTQFGIEPGWEVRTRQVPLRNAEGKALLDKDGQPRTKIEEVARTRVRVNRITRLANDLALALSAPSIRIEAPVPGRPVIGIEVPNDETRIVALRGLLESPEYREAAAKGGLPIALGRDVRGRAVVADLTKMPHVLIAGATGSGKSVCINTIITCLLMHVSPLQLRLVLVDPKRVELTGYGSVPHLALSRVVTDSDEVVRVLGMVVAEMERRYRRLELRGARNIAAYNALPGIEQPMPYWVVVLDELADMMMAAPVEVEQQLVRLAQLSRATGIHLVVATQRPSVDVVTGLIKANFPTRIAFATTSQTDARVIMDRAGAEKLLGKGDMLLMSADSIAPRRVQGAYVSDEEIARVIEAWDAPAQPTTERPSIDEMLKDFEAEAKIAPDVREVLRAEADANSLRGTLRSALTSAPAEPDIVGPDDPLDLPAGVQRGRPSNKADSRFDEAAALAREHRRVSASLLQRRLRVGLPRAERLIELLEQAGIVAPSEGGPSRRVLQRSESGIQSLD